MLQSEVFIKQPLGVPGNISQQQNTYFNIFGAVCADDKVQVGYFVQRGKKNNEVLGVKGNSVSAEIIGLAIFNQLRSSYDKNSALVARGEVVTILNIGNAFIETELKCNSGDYVCVSTLTGELQIKNSIPSGTVFTGFRVVRGNDSASRGVIEITTAGVAGVSTSSGGGGTIGTNYYTKDEVNTLLADAQSAHYTKTEANTLLLNKVDSSSLQANYTNNTGLTSLLAYKADKTSLEQAVKDRLADQEQLQKAVNQTSTNLATQMTTLTSSVNEVKTQLMAADTAMQSDIETIEQKIPTDATATNQLASKEYVREQVATASARAISSDADGNGFNSLAALKAGPWYSLGASVTPTTNDYAVVKKDATHNNNDVRYNYDGAIWVFFQEFTSGSGFTPTTAQSNAMDSGITSDLVAQITTNKNAITAEVAARQSADTDLQVLIGNETTARQQGDNNVLSQAAAGKAELDLKIGDLNNLTVGAKTSVVDCINSLATAYATNFVAKTGDTMTGQLQIEMAGSGDLIRLVGGGKGVTFSMDASTGHLAIRPESAPTTGFDMTAVSFSPRTTSVAYSLGANGIPWNNAFITTINGYDYNQYMIKIDNLVDRVSVLENKPDPTALFFNLPTQQLILSSTQDKYVENFETNIPIGDVTFEYAETGFSTLTLESSTQLKFHYVAGSSQNAKFNVIYRPTGEVIGYGYLCISSNGGNASKIFWVGVSA